MDADRRVDSVGPVGDSDKVRAKPEFAIPKLNRISPGLAIPPAMITGSNGLDGNLLKKHTRNQVMRVNAIVREPERADRNRMKRNPHPVHLSAELTSGLALALILAGGLSPSARAGDEKKPVRKDVAVIDKRVMNAPSAVDGSVTLRNVDGQEIQARLLSVTGDSVKIQRVDDQREFVVPISTFDDYTGAQIRNWMERDPGAIDYSLSVSTEKNLVDSSSFETGGRELKTSKWSYRVTVANLSRNELNGAKIEYRIIFDDEVEFARAAVGPGKGGNQQDGQAIDLPEMAFNDEIEFETPPVDLNTYEYAPSRGEREYAKDSIKGIWIKVTRNGQVISEYQSSPSMMASLSWDNEDDAEIRITNHFRDALGSSVKE